DLPQPLGPIKTVVRPRGTSKSVGRRAATPSYRFETPLSRSIALASPRLVGSPLARGGLEDLGDVVHLPLAAVPLESDLVAELIVDVLEREQAHGVCDADAGV